MHFAALLLLAALANPLKVINADDDHDSLNRNQDLDEGSCICGLNKEILNKIEYIVTLASSQQSCSISSNQPRDEDGQLSTSTATTTPSPDVQQQQQQSNSSGLPSGGPSSSNELGSSTSGGNATPTSSSGGQQNLVGQNSNQSNDPESLVSKLTGEIQALQAQLTGLKPQSSGGATVQQNSGGASSLGSTLNQVWRPSAPQPSGQENLPSPTAPFVTTNWQAGSSLNQNSTAINGDNSNNAQQTSSWRPKPSELGGGGDGGASNEGSTSSSSNGFIQGLPQTIITSSGFQQGANQPGILPIVPAIGQQNNGAQENAGGSIQTAQDVQSAMESTVPNVVSNIFSNIQNLAIQTEHNPNASSGSQGSSSDTLTSIDGSSIHLHKNDTTAQITEQGEQLFLQWMEHQIQTFHMTASMASYIRKTALGLFRRIVKQYVERIERLGGRVEDNVRKATQTALSNTQNLIAFLLRNYLNVAGGLMQIIGEQVSRVGKQLDSTGDTIAHINLNPFDMVSNVIGSLPNPTHYSEYFRAFGKYLMGESSSSTQQSNENDQQIVEQQQTNQQQQPPAQQQQQQQRPQEERHKGLFSKTMGALGKTLGSWLG